MQYHLLRNYGNEIKQETVELILGTSTSFNTLGGEQISFEFPVSNYQYIKEEYLSDTLVHTQLEQIDLIFTATTEELLIYRNSSRSTNSEMIERQVFTNIQNGKGLFTSRIIKKFENVQIIIDTGE